MNSLVLSAICEHYTLITAQDCCQVISCNTFKCGLFPFILLHQNYITRMYVCKKSQQLQVTQTNEKQQHFIESYIDSNKKNH